MDNRYVRQVEDATIAHRLMKGDLGSRLEHLHGGPNGLAKGFVTIPVSTGLGVRGWGHNLKNMLNIALSTRLRVKISINGAYTFHSFVARFWHTKLIAKSVSTLGTCQVQLKQLELVFSAAFEHTV